MSSIRKGDAGTDTRAVIYTRFSPRPNAAECESCDVQESYCREFAARKGWDVASVYSDRAVSGSVDIECRNIHAAISALRKGDVLLAFRRDRLARDLIIGLQIERAVEARGASIAVVNGDVFGNDPGAVMMKQILMVVAEYERKMISVRVSAAMRHYQRNGRRMSAVCPYGWRRDPEDGRRMIPDADEQRVIADVVSWRDGGDSYGEIAERLGDGWTATKAFRVYRRAKA